MRSATVLAILSFALLLAPACGGGKSTSHTGTGGGGTGGSAPCAPGQVTAADGTCFDVGLSACAAIFVDPDGVCRPTLDKCPKGKLPKFDIGCVDVGIAGCATEFMEADGICHVRMDKCAAGTFAVPQKGCVPIDGPDGCGTTAWGAIPDDPGNVYVDPSYAGTDGDGSQAKPFHTIAAALAAVGAGGRIALAAGTYTEPVAVSSDVEIAGRCASMVTIGGNDGDATLPKIVHVTGGTVKLRGITLTGDGIGLYAEGGAAVTLDRAVIQGALLAGAVVDGSKLDVTSSVVRDTRGDNLSDWNFLGNGFGISAILGSQVTVTDSAVVANHTAGLHALDDMTTLTVKDTLIEGTRVSYVEGDGIAVEIFGDTYDTGVKVDVDAVAIVDSETYGMAIRRSAAGTPVVTAQSFVIEGTPGTGDVKAQSAVWTMGGSIELHRGITTRSLAGVESFFYDLDNVSKVTVDQVLMKDGGLYSGDGTIDLTDSTIVDAFPPAIFLAPDQIADMILGNIHFQAQRVLVETPGGMSDALYGYGFFVGGNADAQLDSVFVSKARAAGVLASQQATVKATRTVFSAIQTGKFYVSGMDVAEAGDGFVAADHAKVTLDGVRVEECARVGMLFDGVQGTVTKSLSTKNKFGVVFQGKSAPAIDSASSFVDNSDQNKVESGDLAVPTAPAPVPPG
jgi:hypothetical protein